MIGFCSNCGKQVMDLTQKGAKRFMTNYRDHELEIGGQDGRPKALMRVAVCVNCKALLTSGAKVQATADKILEKHKTFWREHPEDFQTSNGSTFDFDSFKVTDPNSDFDKHRKKKEEFHQKEEESGRKSKTPKK